MGTLNKVSFNQAFHPGDWVGGYVLRRQLGRGGAGVVWEATDEGGNLFALKIIHPGIAADPSARDRLQREANTVNRIRDLGVARVVDLETDGPVAFVVTELVDGISLREHIATRGPLAYDVAVKTAAALYETLRRVHAAGVIHRDLKPSNIILGPSGPVLIDFGIAQFDEDERLTSTGLVSGTPGWVETEVLAGSSPDAESDWWAWAGIVLTMITGRPPFGTGSLNAVVTRQHLNQPDVVGLPPTLARQLRAALGPRESRPTAEEVLDSLEFPYQDDGFDDDATRAWAGADSHSGAADEDGQCGSRVSAPHGEDRTTLLTGPGSLASSGGAAGAGAQARASGTVAAGAAGLIPAAGAANRAAGSSAAGGLTPTPGAAGSSAAGALPPAVGAAAGAAGAASGGTPPTNTPQISTSPASTPRGANRPANSDRATALDGAEPHPASDFEDSTAYLPTASSRGDEEGTSYLPQGPPEVDRTTGLEVSDRTRQIPQVNGPIWDNYDETVVQGYPTQSAPEYVDETATYPALPAYGAGDGVAYAPSRGAPYDPAYGGDSTYPAPGTYPGSDYYPADPTYQPAQPYYFQPVHGATVVTLALAAALCVLPLVMGTSGAIIFAALAVVAMAWGYARQWRELRRMAHGGPRGTDNLLSAARFLPALLQAALALTVSLGAATLVTLGAWSLVQVNLSGNITPNPWLDILLARQGVGVVKSWPELYGSVNMSAAVFLLAAWASVAFAALVMRVGPGGWQLSQGARSLVGAALPWKWARVTVAVVCVGLLAGFFAMGAV